MVQFQSLSMPKDAQFIASFKGYREGVTATVRDNLIFARQHPSVTQGKGIFSLPNYSRWFTVTGAIQVDDLATLGSAATFFRLHSTRYLRRGRKIVLRGKRYLAAIDPGLSVPQTIQTYCDDLHDSLAQLSQVASEPSVKCSLSLAPLLDYAKNSVITLTNAFLYQEKLGHASFDSTYLKLRHELVTVCRKVTGAFYSSLLGELHAGTLPCLDTVWPSILETKDRMIEEYKRRRLSAREFVRPEASHPLILLAFRAQFGDSYHASAVVGLPSGSTELACLLAETLPVKPGELCELFLLPYSRHSMRVQYGTSSDGSALPEIYDRCYMRKPFGERILLVDDNSSSGATLEAVRAFLANVAMTSHIDVGVAEADLRRSELDLQDSKKRPSYAPSSVYRYSVGVLPVARRLWRKHDLKEVIESFSVANHYSRVSNRTDELRENVKAEVYADAARHPFSRLAAEREWATTRKIDKFRDTFLSNFYQVPLSYCGHEFPTVEHAYQWSKFDENRLRTLAPTERQEICGALGRQSINVPEVFFSNNESAGFVKKLAVQLVKLGLERDNWDDVRVDRMIDLTLRKYSVPDLRAKLLSTNESYLLEGNDWGDVFWGACLDSGRYRGRNMLGLILMNVREKLRHGYL